MYSILAERKLGRVSAPQSLVLSPVIRLEIGLGILWVWSVRFLDRGCKELWDCSLQQKNSVRLVGKEWGQKETVGTYHCHSLLVKVPPASVLEEHLRLVTLGLCEQHVWPPPCLHILHALASSRLPPARRVARLY